MTSLKFHWTQQAQDHKARAGILHTAHGDVITPTFMPVGTVGTVKAMTMDAVRSTGAGIVLGNTYHLMLRPGAELIHELGGLHKFMDWSGPILTDSGGFQVMSLGALRKLNEEGVTFRSHIDGSTYKLTPESSTDIQYLLDATITMCFDECPALPASHDTIASSMRMSMRWAERSRKRFKTRPGYAQFGIVQGGIEPDLRIESAEALNKIGFEGYAIGGLAVGEPQEQMFETLDVTVPYLPSDKPRYLMGVGTPQDMLGSVMRGIDMFDCVMPTRAGRTGRAYTSRGTLNMKNACHIHDRRPIDPECDCPACSKHSRAYIHHLFRSKEILGAMLLTWHNLAYYQRLMRTIHQAILDQNLEEKATELHNDWNKGDWKLDEWN